MKILAVDADGKVLKQLEKSLRSVFPQAETIIFDNALKSFKYFLKHQKEVALIYFPLTIRPFDGFKYSSLFDPCEFTGRVILTTQNDNDEIRELIRLNGGNRYIPKPITEEKVRALATLEQEMCLDRYEEGDCSGCCGCVYHWCEKRQVCEEVEDEAKEKRKIQRSGNEKLTGRGK